MLRVLLLTSLAIPLFAVHGSAAATTTSVKLSKSETPPGTAVKVTGSGFGATESVTITLGSSLVLGTSKTGLRGAFTATVVVPASQPSGAYHVRATGQRTGRTAAAGLIVRTSWITLRFNALRNGVNPFEHILGAANVSTLTEKWSKTNAYTSAIAPVLSQGRLFYGTGETIYARSAATGALLWAKPTGGILFAQPTVSGSTLIVPIGFRYVKAYSVMTGALIWKSDFGVADASVMPVTVGHGRAFLVSEQNNILRAVSVATGATIWSKRMMSQLGASALSGGNLLIGDGTRMLALKQSTGAVVWKKDLTGPVGCAPTVANGVVYWGAGGSLRALDPATGAVEWQAPDPACSVAVSADTIYGIGGASLFAYRTSDGGELWHFTTDDVLAGAALANGVAYVGEGYDSGFGGDGNGELFAVNASTGAVLKTLTLGSPIAGEPIVANAQLFAVSRTGVAHAFGLP
jgi:eukaryotic-like serine/threonine-protein kinase